MKKIEEIDPRTLDFEGCDSVYIHKQDNVEQGSEEGYKTKYFKVTESYEDGGF